LNAFFGVIMKAEQLMPMKRFANFRASTKQRSGHVEQMEKPNQCKGHRPYLKTYRRIFSLDFCGPCLAVDGLKGALGGPARHHILTPLSLFFEERSARGCSGDCSVQRLAGQILIGPSVFSVGIASMCVDRFGFL